MKGRTVTVIRLRKSFGAHPIFASSDSSIILTSWLFVPRHVRAMQMSRVIESTGVIAMVLWELSWRNDTFGLWRLSSQTPSRSLYFVYRRVRFARRKAQRRHCIFMTLKSLHETTPFALSGDSQSLYFVCPCMAHVDASRVVKPTPKRGIAMTLMSLHETMPFVLSGDDESLCFVSPCVGHVDALNNSTFKCVRGWCASTPNFRCDTRRVLRMFE